MTMSNFQPRKPAGSPTGGQFDTKPHALTALSMDVSARDLETPEGEVDFRKLFAEQDYSRDPNHPVLFGTYVDYRDQLRDEQFDALLAGDPDNTVLDEIYVNMDMEHVDEVVNKTIESWEESMDWEQWDAFLDKHFDGDRDALYDQACDYYGQHMDESAMSQLIDNTRPVYFRHNALSFDDLGLNLDQEDESHARAQIEDAVMRKLVVMGVDDTEDNRSKLHTMIDEITDDDIYDTDSTISVAGKADGADLLKDGDGREAWWEDSTMTYEEPLIELHLDKADNYRGPLEAGSFTGTMRVPLEVGADSIFATNNVYGEEAAHHITRTPTRKSWNVPQE